jgi:hypothetical protein
MRAIFLAFAHAALATSIFCGTPAGAAGPADLHQGTRLIYNLGTTKASHRSVIFESSFELSVVLRTASKSVANWSPQISDWSGPNARLFGVDPRRLTNAGNVSLTVHNQRVVPRLMLRRHRIVVALFTVF